MSTTQQPPVAYSATSIYTAGMTVIENGVTYQANWWLQGTDPAQNSGVAGSGEAWTIIAGGSTDPMPWSATTVYTAGMKAIENGVIYQANWWIKGSDPAQNSIGAGQPWTIVGAVDPAHAVPTVPTGLAVLAASSSAAILSWNASIVPGNAAPLTGYAVFENGQQIATTTGTSYTVTSLSASTDYQFSVTALDAAGSSARASPISVHTAASAGGGSLTHAFSPYIDMAMSQDADLTAISKASGIQNFTLAFMLSTGGNGIGWQGAGTIAQDTLANGTTMLSQVQAIQAAGGNITISFGGANGQEAALTATSAAALQAEYQSVIDRYHVTSIDFDIEGAAVEDQHSITLRDQALAGLEAANPNVKVSFTLPVLPTGLAASGLNVLQSAKRDGVRIDTVNIMTMDYGASVDNNGQMGLDAIDAIISTEGQIATLGMNSKIGVTPMIGVNDIASEVFTLADAQQLVTFAESDSNVVSIGMWSVARDNGNSAGAHYASSDSSGLAQTPFEFAGIFHQFDQSRAGAGGGTIVGGVNGGTLIGGVGDDVLIANQTQAAADNAAKTTLDGGGGANALYGGGAYTTFIAGDTNGGYNQIWGGASKMTGVAGYTNNTLSFATAPAGVYVDLVNGHNAYVGSTPGGAWGGSGTFEDSIANVSNVIGSAFGDLIQADKGVDRITGGHGADSLYAGTGASSQDTFVYTAYGDSNVVNGYDTIIGFKIGTDKIDLSALHTDASHLAISTAGASNTLYIETTPGAFNSATDLAMIVNTSATGGVHASDFVF